MQYYVPKLFFASKKPEGKRKMKVGKRVISAIIVLVLAFVCLLCMFTGCEKTQGQDAEDLKQQEAEDLKQQEAERLEKEKAAVKSFYDNVSASLDLIDKVGSVIYSEWHDYEYGSKELESRVIKSFYSLPSSYYKKALKEESKSVEAAKANDVLIKENYAVAKDSACGQKVKDVMTIYIEYYELLIGDLSHLDIYYSYSNFSSKFFNLHSSLKSALNALSYEI